MLNPELHLRVAGVLLLSLIALNLHLPRRFSWKRELASLSLLTRQIFWVHAAFLSIVLAMLAALVLLYARHLLAPTPLARAVLAGLAIFWFLRLLTQWLVYDWSLWRGRRFETTVHVVFTCVWGYLTATFAYALWHSLGRAS